MLIKTYWKHLVVLFISAVLIGCNKTEEKSERELVLAFTPSRSVNVVQKSADLIADELSKVTGIKIKSRTLVNYSAVVVALKRGDVDIAFLGPLSYLKAKERADIKPLTVSIRNGMAGYHGVIIAKKDSDINDITDLRGKSIVFADALSTSGYLYPRYAMSQVGIDPSRDVKPLTIASHATIVLSVLTDKVDAGATYIGATENPEVLKKFPKAVDDTKTIWKSPLIPPDVQVIRTELGDDVAKTIADGLAKISQDPVSSKWLAELYAIDELVPITEELHKSYEHLEKISKAPSTEIAHKGE